MNLDELDTDDLLRIWTQMQPRLSAAIRDLIDERDTLQKRVMLAEGAAEMLDRMDDEGQAEIARLRAELDELQAERLASAQLRALLQEWMDADEVADGHGYGIGDKTLIGRTIAAVEGDGDE